MAEIKKLLVAFDPNDPACSSTDFLIPFQSEGKTTLYGLKSSHEHTYGLVVYVGRSITENDLFAKLVDSRAKIEDVDATMSLLRQYIEGLHVLHIGNVVRIDADSANACTCTMELVAKTPRSFSN